MRISEACGLTWNDIDFEKKTVTLDKKIVYVSRKGYSFSTLKTQSSNRKILIDDFLIRELKRWKNQQAENEISAGDSCVYIYRDSEDKIHQQSRGLGGDAAERVLLVCTYSGGKIVSRDSMEKILKRSGINHIRSAILTQQL